MTRHDKTKHTPRQEATGQDTSREDRAGQHEPPKTWGKIQKSGRREGKNTSFI